MNTGAYSVTINLPDELQEYTEDITENYLKIIKNTKYIQVYEHCKTGKMHSHIAYIGTYSATTSNETRKFKSAYTDYFAKKDYPKAIIHKRHDNFDGLVGYLLKEQKIENCKTSITNTDYLENCQKTYLKDYQTRTKISKMSIDEIADEFVKFYADEDDPIFDLDTYVIRFLNSIKEHITYRKYSKLNKKTLLEYAMIKTGKNNNTENEMI